MNNYNEICYQAYICFNYAKQECNSEPLPEGQGSGEEEAGDQIKGGQTGTVPYSLEV